MTPTRPRVLVLADYYLPGYRAGGPIQSIAGMVERLGDSYEFRVVTADRDLGVADPYPNVQPGAWVRVNGVPACYVKRSDLRRIWGIVRESWPDVLYVNSFFSFSFSIGPLLANSLRAEPRQVVLAPRGEFATGALAHSQLKKRLFLALSRVSRLHAGVTWQASSAAEEQDIRRVIPSARVHVAPDLTRVRPTGTEREEKEPGSLRAVFLARVSPSKNLEFALEILRHVRGSVRLTVYGPLEDPKYWERCSQVARALPSNVSVVYAGELAHGEVARVLAQHDILLLPTKHENFGHVILEALAVGTPAVTSDQTPWRRLAQRHAGWDLPLSDESEFVRVVQMVVDMHASEFATWSAGARALADEWLDSEHLLGTNEALFRVALEGRSRAGTRP